MHILSSKSERERMAVADMMDNRFGRYEQKVNPIVVNNASAILKEYGSRLVCPKCAGIMAFTDRHKGYCARCHYQGEAVTVRQYLLSQQYK